MRTRCELRGMTRFTFALSTPRYPKYEISAGKEPQKQNQTKNENLA